MAMFDNYEFLINHIRNSFITSDETGMCELILESDGVTRPSNKHPSSSHDDKSGACSAESDVELAHSLDIVFNMDLSGHRRRSDTAQRLEKLKLDKQKNSKIKHVQWKNASHTVNELEEHFEKKSICTDHTAAPTCVDGQRVKSFLSSQLEQFDMTSKNPFMEFAKFDGRAGGSVPSKKIDIYLTMASPADRSYPMTVVCLSNAKIQQLIGLICWQYTMENREPSLQHTNVDSYTLNMVEDDGDVDSDFPALDSREPLSKFGFNKLALVAKAFSPQSASKSKSRRVVVHTADSNVYEISVDADDAVMRDIFDKVLEQRVVDVKMGQRYKLVKLSAPDVAVDLDSHLSALSSNEFCLVRENSVWPGALHGRAVDAAAAVADNDLMCHQYRSYDVYIVHRLRADTPAQLGVSSDKIELNPSASNTTNSSRLSRHSLLFSKPKAVTLSIDDVAACLLLDAQPASGRRVVRLVYAVDVHFKHLELECEDQIATQIVAQVVNIVNCRPSAAHDNYKSQKTLKLSRRHTLRT